MTSCLCFTCHSLSLCSSRFKIGKSSFPTFLQNICMISKKKLWFSLKIKNTKKNPLPSVMVVDIIMVVIIIYYGIKCKMLW